MSLSRCPPKVAFLPFPRPCVVCGKPTNVQHHKIPYSHFKSGKVKGDPNRKSNVCPMCSPPLVVESCHETMDLVLGKTPYIGLDRFKREALARNVAKLLALDERFIRALPAYMKKAYREFGGDS